MPDFDGLQPFLCAHITAIRPFLFLATARIRAVLRAVLWIFGLFDARVVAFLLQKIKQAL